MIELVYSNRTERLLEELVASLRQQRSAGLHPLSPVELVVPNRNMETWVGLGIAQLAGVAANLRFRRLERFAGELVAEAFGGELRLVDLDTIEAAILSMVLDDGALERPELGPVRSYLESAKPAERMRTTAFDSHLAKDGADLRRVQLSSRLAHLFQEYAYSRPEMIAAWRGLSHGPGARGRAEARGLLPFADPAAADPSLAPTAAWQGALWRGVFGEGGVLERTPPAGGGRWITLDALTFDDALFDRLRHTGPPVVHVFGVSYVARLFQLLFARLGEVGDLRIYTLNPCAEYWEDVETHRELFRRLNREEHARTRRVFREGETDHEDPFGLADADTPALRYWGRPGREHVRLLGELTDCDFESAFADPVVPGDERLLHLLQRDILLREPERVLPERGEGEASDHGSEPLSPDESLKLVAAPSVRREVEWVAEEIWRLAREHEGPSPLRFSDIAVIVNSSQRDVYLPQIEAVFEACHGLPSSVSDLPGAAGSRFIEASSLLLALPFGRFSRAEMLAFMGHPAVIGRFDDASPDDMAEKAEALGIVFGADHEDHQGTYIDEDVFNWDQGVRRLALGAFMTGEKSGDERVFETDRGRWLVAEDLGSSTAAAARFGLLARALIADCRFVREHRMPLSKWSGFFSEQIDAYLHAVDGADARDRLRCLRALAKLKSMDRGAEVTGRVAAEIASGAIGSLGGGRGQYLAEGVVVSSFLPMRAIPFQVVFVLGLGEGLFPGSARRDALDLRSARRRAGDVDPSERDRYMFLETLLCARERLYLSYVRRDEQTGDPLQPSAVVQELLHMLERGYLGPEGARRLRVEPPLRRFDEPSAQTRSFLDESRVEARVQAISDRWREASLGDVGGGAMAPGLRQASRVVDAESWRKLSAMLALPGEPPPESSVSAVARPGDERASEAPVSISLSALRRFLSCPMQGWAETMLGLGEEDDDLSDREEEDFEVGRLQETGLLREVFLDAAAAGLGLEERYEERAARLRLRGGLPVGVLGRAIALRHSGVLEGWRRGMASALGLDPEEGSKIPAELRRVRLGRSGGEHKVETVLDPLVLEVRLPRPDGTERMVPVRISGRTEGLLAGSSISMTFQHGRPPRSIQDEQRGLLFRYLLRGVVDHAVLSAAGEAGDGERRVMVTLASAPDAVRVYGLGLRPLEAESARRWLGDVLTDLLAGSHAYLLPAEAVFVDFCRRSPLCAKKRRKKEPEPEPESARAAAVDGERIGAQVRAMAENEWSRFSSLYGPVPSPRAYEPPPPEEAARIVEARFGPLFRDIIALEGF